MNMNICFSSELKKSLTWVLKHIENAIIAKQVYIIHSKINIKKIIKVAHNSSIKLRYVIYVINNMKLIHLKINYGFDDLTKFR